MTKIMLRLPAVRIRTGLPRSTLYDHISKGLFPRPVRLGLRARGWPDDEVDAINAARIAEKSDEEIRQLVATLEAAREMALIIACPHYGGHHAVKGNEGARA